MIKSAAALISAGLLLVGCAGPAAYYERKSSNFAFPNSNVKPIGAASGTASSTSVFFPDISNPDLEELAVRNALEKSGGDLIIDMKVNRTSTYVYFLIPIYTNTVTVEGQAAEMELGRQPRAQYSN